MDWLEQDLQHFDKDSNSEEVKNARDLLTELRSASSETGSRPIRSWINEVKRAIRDLEDRIPEDDYASLAYTQ